jgi:hypothetical protein
MTDIILFAKLANRRSSIRFALLSFIILCMATSLLAQQKSDTSKEKDVRGALATSFYEKLSKGATPASTQQSAAINRHTFTGQGVGNSFGYSISAAGDVNGDGFADVIVGAYGYASGTGRAYVYFGGPGMDNVADVTMAGETIGNYFGISVSSAGDVNGDGYADVIVGASGFLTQTGRAYIYYGGSHMDTTADVTITGEATGNSFGASVSCAGDVNGDGYADVIIGASGYSTFTGRAYIYFGGSSMNNTADVTMTGETTYNYFGRSVSTAGDVNGDGYADAIVGAYGYSAFTGRAYIYFGGSSMNNIADATMTGEATSNRFGVSVASAGDVNGDGFADVIVGAYGYSTFTGRAYIYFGGSNMNNIADVTLTGEATGNYFGASVSTAGDVNGDGYADVVIGAYAYSTTTGRAYVYYGGPHMDTAADKTLTGEASGNWFGFSVSTAGDVNGDGYADLLVGADKYTSSTGRVYLYQMSLTGADIPDEKLTGEAGFTDFGYSVSTAGDVNGDGYPDVIVGAFSYAGGPGRAYIYFGGPKMDSTADVTLTGETAKSHFGSSVSTAGDVNGDGYADVIVGAPEYMFDVGRAYIYYGGASMDTTADVVMTGEASGLFGHSVSSAGDVNGDGYADVIVGAGNFSSGSGQNSGRAYLYYGGASMDTTADVIMTGTMGGDALGISVSAAGDVNGDGYADVIVGAYGANNYRGRADIYYGGPSMNNISDVTMWGRTLQEAFGCSVSTAGDVNGDGYADVIVGAYAFDSFRGRAYIFCGGVVMDDAADVTLAGETMGIAFGKSVSTAGDVNGDGFADVIVGSEGNAYAGRADIYYGGSSMDNVADITMTGEAANNYFGDAVSTTGDLNGDGCADVIVGAYQYSSGTGRAYIYRSSSPPIVPRIASIVDVPHDQGGVVDVRWIRSGYDARNVSRVTGYRLERSDPPGMHGFAWTTVADIAATHNPQYSHPALMPYDSSTGTGGTFFFRITAVTASNEEYWRSNIVSGHSVDNIPPIGVGGAVIAASSNGRITLRWNKNREDKDLLGYVVYRDTTGSLLSSHTTQLDQTSDSTYVDSLTTPGKTYYYRVAAIDIHGNVGAPSAELTQIVLAVQRLNGQAPKVFELSQNYPNPFNPSTTIEFTVPVDGHAVLKVMDMLGREVATLFEGDAKSGYYLRVVFDASKCASGVYFSRLESGGKQLMKKMILMK